MFLREVACGCRGLVGEELGVEQQLCLRLSGESVALRRALRSAEGECVTAGVDLEAEREARSGDVERLDAEKRALQSAASTEMLRLRAESTGVRRKFVTATRDLLQERKKTAAAEKVLDKADEEVSELEGKLGASTVSFETLERAMSEKDAEMLDLRRRLAKVTRVAEESAVANLSLQKAVASAKADRVNVSTRVLHDFWGC